MFLHFVLINDTVLPGAAVEIYFWTFPFYLFSTFFMNILNFGAGFRKYWLFVLNLYTTKLLKLYVS